MSSERRGTEAGKPHKAPGGAAFHVKLPMGESNGAGPLAREPRKSQWFAYVLLRSTLGVFQPDLTERNI